MPDEKPINDIVRGVLDGLDAGESLAEGDLPTIATQRPDGLESSGQNLGALPGHAVERLIARGGMGAVYLAQQHALEREVAVKVMTRDAESPEMAARFRREALVLGKLAHPNIVPVYDIGTDEEGQLFYTMKLVKGRTLQDILHDLRREEPDTMREHTLTSLLTVFRKVCDAMAFAHSQGVIHRDLKPENIMVGEFGEVLVMDWGLAKTIRLSGKETIRGGDRGGSDQLSVVSVQSGPSELGADSDALNADYRLLNTLQGSVMGTPQYMSPEQARGEIDELDERSDIFSLGGILYSILTLRPPVEGKTLREVLEKVKSGGITSPTELQVTTTRKSAVTLKGDVLEAKLIKPLSHIDGGRVPAALSSVVMKALRLDKVQRYQSVAAFSADIEAFQGGFATSAEQAGLVKQLVLLVMRHKGIFTTAAAAWFIVTALAVWFVFNLRAKEQRAKNAEASAVQKAAETSKALARSALSLAEAALREGNGPAMRTALQDVPENQRDSTWRYLFGQSDSSFATFDFGGGIDDVAAHPCLPHVFAVVDHSGMVTMLNVRTGERLLEFKVDVLVDHARFYRMALSRDGERIAIGTGLKKSRIAVHDARDGRKIFGSECRNTTVLVLSSDGRLLLQGGQRDEEEGEPPHLTLRDATSGDILWTVPVPDQPRSLIFLADARQIFMQAHHSPPMLFSITDGSLLRKLAPDPADIAALSPDGRSVVTLNRESVVRGVKLDGEGAEFEVSAGDEYERTEWNWLKVAFSGSGDRFVSVIPLGDGRQAIRVWDAKTHAPRQILLGGMGRALGVAIHPLSGELIVCGPQTRAWSLDGARWTFRDQNRRPPTVAFWDSDDLILTSANDAAKMSLYSLEGEEPSSIWASRSGDSNRVAAVSADGQMAAVGLKIVRALRREGREVREVGGFEHEYQFKKIRLSTNGDHAAILRDMGQNVQLYETATGKRPVELNMTDLKRFFDLAWLHDRHLLGLAVARGNRGGSGAEEQIVVWDTTTGKILRRATNTSAMDVLAVAPDGSRFAEAGADKKVRIRDAATLSILKEFRAHDGPITALEWHPTRAILATGSEDLTVRLWNLETGERIEEFRGPLVAPNDLVFSPGGRRLACAALDGTTRIWEPSSLREEAAAPVSATVGVIDEHVWFKVPLSDRPVAP